MTTINPIQAPAFKGGKKFPKSIEALLKTKNNIVKPELLAPIEEFNSPMSNAIRQGLSEAELKEIAMKEMMVLGNKLFLEDLAKDAAKNLYKQNTKADPFADLVSSREIGCDIVNKLKTKKDV